MAHEIKADSNTYVGYNFLTSEYYVKNLETKTATKTAIDAKIVLDITAPGNIVTTEEIELLSRTLEPVVNISYTLEDTGKYIKTIYFNDYKAFAMQYNEPFLFIRGSNEMWNMSSTIGIDSVSTFMWQYYVYHLGLDMPKALMNSIIEYYKEIQKPYVYNIIEPRTQEDIDNGKPLMFTNQITLNNYNGTSRGEYIGTKNPDNIYTLNTYNITKAGFDTVAETFPVNSIEKNRSRINMAKMYPEGTFEVGRQIEIFGTESVDGVYTIDEVRNDNEELDNATTHIIVKEYFEKDYLSLYSQNIMKIVNPSYAVSNVQKATSTIIFTNPLEEGVFSVGTKVEIFNTGVIDGFYIVHTRNSDSIIVYRDDNVDRVVTSDTFNDDYIPTSSNTYIIRESEQEITENSITCVEEPECAIGDIVQIITSDTLYENYTVTNVKGHKIYVDKSIPRITTSNKAKAWCNSYIIKQCGFTGYTEVSDSRQISSISGNVVKLYDTFIDKDYTANMKVYVNYGDRVTEHTVTGVTAPVYGSTYTEGTLTLSPNPTAYTYNLNNEPIYLEVRKSYNIPENSFLLNAPAPLNEDDMFEVFNNTAINGTYKVESIDGNKIYVVRENGDEPIPEMTFNGVNSGIIQTRRYSNRILLNMTYSRLADRTPLGEFMLDNDEQFTEYLELYRIVTPESQNYIDINQPVTMKYYLGDNLYGDNEGSTYMNCIGLYSEHYKDA